jgi:beta-lactamase regulating signal transducer with metallopeptidase domain
MRYWLLASLVTFSSFTIGFGIVNAAELLMHPLLLRRLPRSSPSRRATMLFWFRLLPAAAALTFAVALVLPTFLYYEPLHTDEPLTRTMALAAAVGLLVLQRTIVRIARTSRATRQLAARWRATGRRIPDLASGLPTFAIDDRFPTVAVVGWIRPALFVSERVFSECTREEIDAMVSHEQAHIAARDNLKRLLLRACPAVPSGSRLDVLWSAAAEEAADARAATAHPDRRLDLASALIRLARLAPPPSLPAGVSAFYHGGSIEERVRQLLDPAPAAPSTYGCALTAFSAAALAAAFVVSAPAIHTAMEALVRLVP